MLLKRKEIVVYTFIVEKWTLGKKQNKGYRVCLF